MAVKNITMVLIDNLYGEECPQMDVKKTSRDICEKCPYVTSLYGTFSVCYLNTKKSI